MKQTTSEWIAKAEADYATMQRESRVGKNPNYDAVCFHSQRCAEKYIKARLCEADVSFGKIHDLVALLEQVLAIELGWEKFREDLAYLSDFAVSFRYPGESADKSTAQDAQKRCTRFRKAARLALTPKEEKNQLF
jgi:HEPN domain-containing protein